LKISRLSIFHYTTLSRSIPQLEYLNRWLSMQRIGLPLGRKFKTDSTLRIRNTGVTPITVNSITITNTNKNVDVDGNGNANDLTTDRKSTRLNSSHVKISY